MTTKSFDLSIRVNNRSSVQIRMKDENNLFSAPIQLANAIINTEQEKRDTNPVITAWVRGCLTYDYTKNRHIERAFISDSGKRLFFKLKEVLVPKIIETRDSDYFYFLTDEQREILKENPCYLVEAISVDIPHDVNDSLSWRAYMPDAEGKFIKTSQHPNVSSGICMGSLGIRNTLFNINANEVIDMLYVANKGSAYRWFGEADHYEWKGDEIKLENCIKQKRI